MPPIPPTKKKPVSDFAAAFNAAAGDAIHEPIVENQAKGKSEFALALEEADKKKVGTTDSPDGSTPSAAPTSNSEAPSSSQASARQLPSEVQEYQGLVYNKDHEVPNDAVVTGDKETSNFFKTIKQRDYSAYDAFVGVLGQYGYSKIKFADSNTKELKGDKNWAAFYDADNNQVLLNKEKLNPLKDDPTTLAATVLEELAHKIQFDKSPEKYRAMVKEAWSKKEYGKNYDEKGSLEYDAHKVISPKIIDDFTAKYNENKSKYGDRSLPEIIESQERNPVVRKFYDNQPFGNGYNVATLNGLIKPEGTFKQEPIKPVQDFISQLKGNAKVENGVLTIHDGREVKGGQDLPDIKDAIDATVNNKIKKDRGIELNTPVTQYEKEAATKVVTDAYKRGDLVLSKDSSGKSVLKRGAGFLESFVNALNQTSYANAENNAFNSLSKEDKIKFLNQNKENPEAFNPTPESAASGLVGKGGEFLGENSLMLAEGAVGGMVAPAAAPAAWVTGASNFGSFLTLANDFAKGGYRSGYEKTYYALKKQGLSDGEAADKAEIVGVTGAATQTAVGAVLSGSIHIPELSVPEPAVNGFVEGIVKSAGNLLKKEAPKMAATSAGGSLVESGAQAAVGVDVDPSQALKDAVEAGGHGAVIAAAFWGLHEPLRIPSYLRPQAENIGASIPVEAREEYLNKAVEQEVITEEQKVKISKTINEFGETKKPLQDLPISEEKKAAITGKLVQAKKIQEEIDSLAPYGASFNDRIAQLTAQKEEIHADVNKMYGAEDVFSLEKDSLTGESPTAPAVVMPDQVNRPTTEIGIAPDAAPKSSPLINEEINAIQQNIDYRQGKEELVSGTNDMLKNDLELLKKDPVAYADNQIKTERYWIETANKDNGVMFSSAEEKDSYLSSKEEKIKHFEDIKNEFLSSKKQGANESQVTNQEVPVQQGNEGTAINNESKPAEEGSSPQATTAENIQPTEAAEQSGDLKEGDIIVWDKFGNEKPRDWTIGKRVKTRGGVDAVEVHSMRFDAARGLDFVETHQIPVAELEGVKAKGAGTAEAPLTRDASTGILHREAPIEIKEEVRNKFQELDNLRNAITKEGANRKERKNAVDKFLQENPHIDAVDRHFSNITKELEAAGHLKKSSADCP